MKRIIPFFFICLFSMSLNASTPHDTRPSGFIENKGQIKNQQNSVNNEVLFLSTAAPGVNIQLRSTGISFDTYKSIPNTTAIAFHRMDMNILSVGPNTKIVPGDKLPGLSNYIRAKTSATGLRSYANVTYQNVAEGIDFVVKKSNLGLVKYDFVINEHADISNLKLEYAGFDSFNIQDGKLYFTLSGKTISEEIPTSWMTTSGRSVTVKYKIITRSAHSVTIGFKTRGKLKKSEGDLVIDPLAVREWATYYGDSLYDKPEGIATDSLGNIFIVGTTRSLDRMASEGSYQSEFAGGDTDAFLVRFNQHGLRQWATYYGGSGDDFGLDVDVDSYERLFIVGRTNSTDSIGSENSAQPANGGNSDGFVAQFDRHGNFIWDSYIGGSGNEEATACYADNRGNVIVSGNTDSGGFLSTDSVSPIVDYHAGIDAFMVKYDHNGQIAWSSYFGGEGDDYSSDIVVDSLQNWVMTGNTNSTQNIVWGGVMQQELAGGKDGYAVKIDSTGTIQWATYFGGLGNDSISGVETVNGAYFFSGKTDSLLSYADTTSFQSEPGGNGDAFVFSLSEMGSLNWFTYLGGSTDNAATDISRDYAGDIYVSGYSPIDSVFNPDTMGIIPPFDTDYNYFVSKFDKTGQNLYTGTFGGENDDRATALAVYGYTSIYLTGTTLSEYGMWKDGPEEDAYQTEKDSTGLDGFITRLTQYSSTPPISIGGNGCCGGGGGGNGSGGGGNGQGPPPIGVCAGDSILLHLNGGALGQGAQWVWYVDTCGGTDNYIGEGEEIWVSPDTTTTYYVRAESVQNEGGCSHKTVHVDYPNTAIASANDSICPGSELELFGEGGYYYSWTGPEDYTSIEQNPVIDTVGYNQAGQYTLVAMTQFGCSDTTTADVFLLSPPSFSTSATNVSCHGGSNGSVSVSPGELVSDIFWPTLGSDSTTVDSLSTGSYPLVVTNFNGCSSGTEVAVAQPNRLIDSLWTSPAYCDHPSGSGHVVIAGDHSPFTVEWGPLGVQANPADDLLPGDHTVFVTDNIGCQDSMAFNLGNIGQFTAVIDPDSVVLEPLATSQIEVYTLPELENPTYSWSPAAGLSCTDCPNPTLNPNSSTTYTVLVTSQHKCTSTDSIYVKREQPQPNTFVPTVFSPNGDGLNDKLCLLGVRIVSFELQIFDRAGENVFSTNDLKNCWDGTVNGKPVTGTFIYTLNAKLQEGNAVNETGEVSVRR